MDLSAGAHRTCGVRTDGEMVCWGDPQYGNTPAGQYLRVDIMDDRLRGYGCAVAVDASVVCWGGTSMTDHYAMFGELDAPVGEFVDVSVGGTFAEGRLGAYSCGLLTDGSARCWGDDRVGGYEAHGVRGVPDGPFVEVFAGDPPCGLRVGGDYVCWGDRASLVPRLALRERLLHAAGGKGISTRSGSRGRRIDSCGIRRDSTLLCWRLNIGGVPDAGEQLEAPEGEFVQLSMTVGPSCALRTDRSIMCWNVTRPGNDEVFEPPEGEFAQIAVGAVHACAIRLDGTVACWGSNYDEIDYTEPSADGYQSAYEGWWSSVEVPLVMLLAAAAVVAVAVAVERHWPVSGLPPPPWARLWTPSARSAPRARRDRRQK